MCIMLCDCEKPEPKHELGVFCVKCRGFIEVNNEARKKFNEDQAKSHPWFKKKPPVKVQTEEKSTSGTEVPKSTFQWFEEEKAATPISKGDLRLADIQAKVIFEWSDKIIADVDEDNKPVAYKSGWIMNVLPQKIIFRDNANAFLASTRPEFNLEKLNSRKESLKSRFKGLESDFVHRIMSDRDIEILEEHRDLMEDIITGNYKPDSFTNQPIQILIDRLLNK